MNMAPPIPSAGPDDGLSASDRLLKSAVAGLDAFALEMEPVKAAVLTAKNLGDDSSAKIAAQLEAKIEAFEPSVTMIEVVAGIRTSC